MDNTSNETPAGPRRTLLGRIARVLLRGCQLVLVLIALYFLVVLVGLIPVNNDFEPTADGVEIIVTSTSYHADLVVPIRNETMDWRQHLPASDFTGDVSRANRVAFGWGNKEFYVDTRTWEEMSAGTLCRAVFWPSATCMHVEMWNDWVTPEAGGKTRISNEQYRRLVDHILSSFRRDEAGRFLRIEKGAYSSDDAFYHANGSYHGFNTCNCWVGDALKAAGVRAPWFTPLPKTVALYMPTAKAD